MPCVCAARCCRSPTRAGSSISPAGLPTRHRAPFDRRDGRGAGRRGHSRFARSPTSPGFPEMMDGRVKTLHPSSTPGCSRRATDMADLGQVAGLDIDLSIVREPLPVRAHGGPARRSDSDVVEMIDVGGPSMVRGAAKNFAFAAVVVNPEAYDAVLEELRDADVMLSLATREALAADAFAYTARYDTAIARWFAERGEDFPRSVRTRLREARRPPLRREPASARGVLPAGRGARPRAVDGPPAPRQASCPSTTCSTSTRRARVIRDFEVPACAIVKHNNPCGAGLGATALDAYSHALRLRPAERVRRDRRPEPAGRPRAGRARSTSSSSRS